MTEAEKQELILALQEAADELVKAMLDKVQEICSIILDCLKKLQLPPEIVADERTADKKRPWGIPEKCRRYHGPLLDRRVKIHRCRNCC